MKKRNMLIAVFAVITAASAAKAGDTVDFDGKGAVPMSFTEVIQNADSCQNDKINCAEPKAEIMDIDASIGSRYAGIDFVKSITPIRISRISAKINGREERIVCELYSSGVVSFHAEDGKGPLNLELSRKLYLDEAVKALALQRVSRNACSGFVSHTTHHSVCTAGTKWGCDHTTFPNGEVAETHYVTDVDGNTVPFTTTYCEEGTNVSCSDTGIPCK